MRILSLSASVLLQPHLGSGKTRLRWTSGLKELGHTVDILQLSDVNILTWLRKGRRLKLAVGTFLAARNMIKKNQYDLIEFYGDDYWLLLWWLKKVRKKAPLLVAHVDGLEVYDREKERQFWSNGVARTTIWTRINDKLSLSNFQMADKFVCGCDDELKYVIRERLFSAQHAVCISPGIDDEFHQLDFIQEKKKNIIFFGSWIKRKGVAIIPDVVAPLLEKHPDLFFEVYGAWSSRDEILASFPGCVHDRILVHGKLPVTDLIAQLSRSAVFLFPTYSEGFGLATLEAMSCGIVVVTTPTGIGCNLKDNHDAKICGFNAVRDMKSAIEQVIGNTPLRESIAYNGFLFAKQFVWKKQVGMLEQQYLQWLA